MIFEKYINSNREAFLTKVKSIAAKLFIDPEWLMAVMYLESGINSKAVNSNGGATGLIQFMPSTASSLGTSTAALYNMTNVQQLDYVYKYFKPYAGRIYSFPDLYLITFFPVALGKSDSYVLQTNKLSAETIANANPVFDLDKNRQITVGEFKKAVYSRLPDNIASYLKKKNNQMKYITIAVAILIIAGASYFLFNSLKGL